MGGEGLLAPVSCSEAFSFEVRSSHALFMPNMPASHGINAFAHAWDAAIPQDYHRGVLRHNCLEGQHPPPPYILPCYSG